MELRSLLIRMGRVLGRFQRERGLGVVSGERTCPPVDCPGQLAAVQQRLEISINASSG